MFSLPQLIRQMFNKIFKVSYIYKAKLKAMINEFLETASVSLRYKNMSEVQNAILNHIPVYCLIHKLTTMSYRSTKCSKIYLFQVKHGKPTIIVNR